MIQGQYVIDVRTQQEWDAGHIDGALHIPMQDVPAQVPQIIADRHAPIGLYCAVGARSGAAVAALRKIGYDRAVNLGGMDQARQKLNIK